MNCPKCTSNEWDHANVGLPNALVCLDCGIVYNAQIDRKWTNLNDDDFKEICEKFRVSHGGWVNVLALEIEAKLREKNT